MPDIGQPQGPITPVDPGLAQARKQMAPAMDKPQATNPFYF
jgi:hypothetical protein